MSLKKFMPQLTAVVIALIVLAYIIIVPIGVADGGGQYKYLESLGLNYTSEPSADYFAVQYGAFKSAQISNTQSAIAALAIGQSGKVFNVISLALIYSLLFIIGLWISISSILRDDKINWAAALISVFVFADIGYTAYFNTLYSEGAVLTAFLIAVGLILTCHKMKAVSVYITVLAVASSLAFALCGTLQAWVGVILGLLIVRLSRLTDRKICKYASVAGGIAVVVISIVFAFTYKPAEYEKNIFHSVFLGTAKYESVAKLGLNPKLDELEGKFYSEDLIQKYNLQQEFFDKMNYGKITAFYTTHPGAYIKEISGAVKNAYTIRPSYLGNYTEASHKDKKLAGGFGIYSTLKSKFVPNTLAFTLIFFLIYLGMLIFIYLTEKDKRPIAEVLIGLGLSAAVCLKVPVLLSGGFEIGRALFTFNIMFDAMIISAIVAGGRYMLERRKNLQSKYGAKQ